MNGQKLENMKYTKAKDITMENYASMEIGLL